MPYMDAVPTALPDEETSKVGADPSIPDQVEFEATRMWVRGWAIIQEVRGESTIRIQPPHSAETMRINTTAILECVPEPIEDAIDIKYVALCRLVHLAELYGWNDPGDIETIENIGIDGKARVGKHHARAETPYGDGRIGSEIDVMRTDPHGDGRNTGIRLVISDWPDFKRWFRDRLGEGFCDLAPVADEHLEFFRHLADTLDHHQPAADGGQHIIITNL